jgi:hypothetical protein
MFASSISAGNPMARKYSKGSQKQVEKVMRERKASPRRQEGAEKAGRLT